jgi:membrane peptidoglycan carboxypeptidase
MGRDDNQPMRGITGGLAPAEFWKSYMRVALKHTPVTPIPPGPPAPVAPPPIPTSEPGETPALPPMAPATNDAPI